MANYFLGIDGGGSKCKAIITNENSDVLGVGLSGGANPFHGVEQAQQSIVESATLALNDAALKNISLNDLIAGVGLAGVNLPEIYQIMKVWQHPFKKMHLATDLFIACLGAHNGNDGAVIITGTGSSALGYINKQTFVLGGHGFPYGDQGGGAWLGFRAVQQVLLSLDGLIVSTALTNKVLAHLNANSTSDIVENIAGKPAAFFAQMATYVFQCAKTGDEVSSQILSEATHYINGVARQLLNQNSVRISLIGGLSSFISPYLATDIQGYLSEPLFAPEIGAIIYAQQQEQNI